MEFAITHNLSIDFEDVAHAVKTSYKFNPGADNTFLRYEGFCDALDKRDFSIHDILEYFVFITCYKSRIEWLPNTENLISYLDLDYASLFNKLSDSEINYIKFRLFDTSQIIREFAKEEELLALAPEIQRHEFRNVYSSVQRIYLSLLKLFVVDYQIETAVAIRFLKKMVAYKLDLEVLSYLSETKFSELHLTSYGKWIDLLLEMLISKKDLTSKEQMAYYYLYLKNWSLDAYGAILKAMDGLHLNEDFIYVLDKYNKEQFRQDLPEIEEWIDFRLTRNELKELFDILKG